MRKEIHEIIDVAEMLNNPRVVSVEDDNIRQDKAEKFDVLCELISGEYDSIHPAQLKHPIGLFLERLKEAVPDVW